MGKPSVEDAVWFGRKRGWIWHKEIFNDDRLRKKSLKSYFLKPVAHLYSLKKKKKVNWYLSVWLKYCSWAKGDPDREGECVSLSLSAIFSYFKYISSSHSVLQ